MAPTLAGRSAVGLVAALTALLLVGCGGDAAGRQVTVKALWVGNQSDGTLTSGVTPVKVVTRQAQNTNPLAVDLAGLDNAGAGAAWVSAAWSAATVGALGAAVNPQGMTISYSIKESIDGPSGGGVMTVGVLADLNSGAVDPSVTMTGTILPTGGIGPVGGIPEKLRAAQAAGLKKVLIPVGQTNCWDPRTNTQVDVVDEGKQLGLEVVPVASVRQAYEAIVGAHTILPTAEVPPMDPALIHLLTAETRRAVAALAKLTVEPAATPELTPVGQGLSADRKSAMTRATQLLAEGDPATAFARATLAERSILAWNARSAAMREATTRPAETTATLAARADAIVTSADAAIAKDATTKVQFLEQITALPDALSWGTDAYALAVTTRNALTDAASKPNADVIGQSAANLMEAHYNLYEYLTTTVQAVGMIRRTPITNTPTTLSQLDSYAQLLAQAGDANLKYHATVDSDQAHPDERIETSLANVLAARWQQRPDPTSMGPACGAEPTVHRVVILRFGELIDRPERIHRGRGFRSRRGVSRSHPERADLRHPGPGRDRRERNHVPPTGRQRS
ncbi:MAG: S16 family serine protease [Actinomycetes bacterium]